MQFIRVAYIKIANVVSLFKEGDRFAPSNDHAVSLSRVCRIIS